MQFNYTLNHKDYLINGISLKKFKELQLYIQLKDNKQILKYFKYFLNNSIDLNIFDQLKLLLYNLIITTRDKYEFSLNDEKNKNVYSIKIEDILNNINSISINDYILKIDDNFSLKIGIPNDFFIYNEETLQQDLLEYNTYNYFKQIIVDDEEIMISKDIIDQLPGSILSQVSNKIKEWDNILKNVPFFNKQLDANCQIVTLFEFIKKIFTYNYKDLLIKEYTLFKYIRIDNYNDINLNEANAIIGIFNEDLAKQQQEIENSTQSSKSIDIPSKNK